MFGLVASSQAQTPLPGDILIVPPSSAVAQDAARFSGAWLGVWGGDLPTAVVVERVSSNGTANLIYSWGSSPVGRFEAGWLRRTGQITNGKLHFLSKSGTKIDFTLQTNGWLLGRYEPVGEPPSFAELRRIAITNVPALLEAAKKPAIFWEETRVPVQSRVGPTQGKTFGLQTTIYRQPSAGKHPVVIFNHGSTGPGIVPPNFVYRGGSEELFFRSLGYAVVIPMRKGRGASDGPNLEEESSVTPALQLESAIEDLQAVVTYVGQQKDMDPKRIIVAGSSRGGLLSVAYAGRYPSNVVGVINFSGGWFGEGMPEQDFNFEAFGRAGRDGSIPMLWLYADRDICYSLKFIEKGFARFREAGGRGELVEFRDIVGEGHLLSQWVDRWRDKVTSYLGKQSKN